MRGRAVVLPLIGATIAVAAWWSATVVFEIQEFFLPSPADIANAIQEQPTYLLQQTWNSVIVTLSGFGIAALTGLVLAIALAASRTIERATLPLFVALNSVPKVAIAPLLVAWLGFGPRPKIVLVVLICFFPVIVSAAAGLAATPAELGELVRSLSASWWQTYVKVRLPWALPHIFVGLKVSVSLAVIGTVVAEISSPQAGLGSVIVLSGQSLNTALAFAAITILALMSITLFYLVVGLERLLLPWAKEIAA
jgi:NitT/TauT family transport system permease protein